MNRFILTTSLLSLAAAAFGIVQHADHAARATAASLNSAWTAASNRLAVLETERQALFLRKRDLKPIQPPPSPEGAIPPALAEWLLSANQDSLPGEVAAHLRKTLGLTWGVSPDFVWVSKQSLRQLRVEALQTNAQLTKAVCALLAFTPEECARVETAIRDASAANTAWFKEHLRRVASTGDVVVQYVIPADFRHESAISLALDAALAAAIGQERSGLFVRYAAPMLDRECGLSATLQTTLIVRRVSGADTANLAFELIREVTEESSPYRGPQPGEVFGVAPFDRERPRLDELFAYRTNRPILTTKAGTESCRGIVTPGSFPAGLRTVFPGGWPEVAQREGFELPEGFENRPPGDTRSRLQDVLPNAGHKQ